MLTVFWDMKDPVAINILKKKDKTINIDYYCQLRRQQLTLFIEWPSYLKIQKVASVDRKGWARHTDQTKNRIRVQTRKNEEIKHVFQEKSTTQFIWALFFP